MIAAAHGNRTRITATVHPASKPGAAAFLALPPTTISATAAKAVGMAMAAGYDGVQLDWEGLQIGSEAGFERFVAACAAALATRRQPHPALLQNSTTTWSAPRPTLSVTVYAPKLVYKDFGPYNLRTLSRLADQVFVMGYDMAPVGVAVGDGWKQVGAAPARLRETGCLGVTRVTHRVARGVAMVAMHGPPVGPIFLDLQ